MTRLSLLIVGTSFGLSFALLGEPKIVHAQVPPRPANDTIYFHAATRGTVFDSTGNHKWCWVLRSSTGVGWHESYDRGPSDALDEVPQTAQGCPSLDTQEVDLTTFGYTDNATDYTTPCDSLRANGTSGQYSDGCHFIEVALYDSHTWDWYRATGDWKGTQRMLHTQAPTSEFPVPTIRVASTGVYQTSQVGTVVYDNNCAPGGVVRFTDYHVHHDWVPPTVTDGCNWFVNTSISPLTPQPDMQQTDWQKENPAHRIHAVVHPFGWPCVRDPGQSLADSLLGPGGALDDTGAGTLALATGTTSITTQPTSIPRTNWQGTVTVTPELLVATYRNYQGMSPIDYFNAQQQSFPDSGNTAHRFWYGPDSQGYYLEVWWIGTYIDPISGYRTDCSPGPAGGPRYWAGWTSNSFINRCGGQDSVSIGGAAGSPAGIDYYWGSVSGRGRGESIDPAVTATAGC